MADRSPGDKPWDVHRAAVDRLTLLCSDVEHLERYAARMAECSGRLRFDIHADDDGVCSIKLKDAYFCRVRFCPVCQWRRSLMWKARFYQAVPKLVEETPGAKWIFLTLTVRNCPVDGLRAQLDAMNKAWGRLTKTTAFKNVVGWVRTVEVTKGRDGSAHPHFHVMAQVKSTYFNKGHYLTHGDWVQAWRAAMRLDYDPVVDVRAVRNKATGQLAASTVEGLRGAVAEVMKYAVKPSDMEADAAWFGELVLQLHRTRAIAAGGTLKDVFKPEEKGDDLLVTDETPDADPSDSLGHLTFNWAPSKAQYRRRIPT